MLKTLRDIFKKSFNNTAATANENVFVKDDYPGFEDVINEINEYVVLHPEEMLPFKDEIEFINTKLDDVCAAERIFYSIIPYPFIFKYDYSKLPVYRDVDAGMFYVHLDGKKLYYHRGFTNPIDIQKSFTFLSIEQNIESPHRYLDDDFTLDIHDTVADIGAAEGNFSLMIVDKVKELIIVEADPVWIEALNKTFEPWKDKVKIINKFIGSVNDQKTLTLDTLNEGRKIDAIKMDVEGVEIDVLKAAEEYIRNNDIKMAITVYHNHSDANDIKVLLEKNNYITKFSKGHMLFFFSKLKPPFFRKGLIKAGRL